MNFTLLKQKALEAGISEIEVYATKTQGMNIALFNSIVDNNRAYLATEFYVRGVYNGKISSVYVEDDCDDVIDEVISQIKSNATVIETTKPYIMYEGDKDYPQAKENHATLISANQAIEFGKKVEEYVRNKSEYIKFTQVNISMADSSLSIENTSGLNISDSGIEGMLMVSCTMEKDGDIRVGRFMKHFKTLEDINLDEIYDKAIDRPLKMIGAKSIPSKTYPVVLENQTAAMLIGCFTSMFGADNVLEKKSLLEGKLETKVFGENITIIDDPMDERSSSTRRFDDEGVKSSKKTVVEHGVLKTYLHNLSTAKQTNCTSTGNGYKKANGDVGVGVSNFCLSHSDHSLEEMIKDIKEGVYLTNLQGAHAGVYPVSGVFNLQSGGFMIRDGKIAEPVTLIIVSGNFMEMMNNIVDISNDFIVERGIGTGSIYVKELSIAGK